MLNVACLLLLVLFQHKQFLLSYWFLLIPFDIWAVLVRYVRVPEVQMNAEYKVFSGFW